VGTYEINGFVTRCNNNYSTAQALARYSCIENTTDPITKPYWLFPCALSFNAYLWCIVVPKHVTEFSVSCIQLAGEGREAHMHIFVMLSVYKCSWLDLTWLWQIQTLCELI